MLNKKTIKFIGILLICIVLMTSCTQKKEEAPLDVSESEEGIVFSAFDLDSDELIKNEMLKKDINLVSVWQIPCPPCETEMKAISSIKDKYPEVEFIGLCVAENSHEIKNTMTDWGINFANYKIDPVFIETMKGTLKRTPSMFVVDSKGNELMPLQEGLVSSGATVEDVANHIESLIKELKNEK